MAIWTTVGIDLVATALQSAGVPARMPTRTPAVHICATSES